MPRGDRTGPFGSGPQDGRQLGYCAGYNVPGYAQGGFFGGGFGRGRAAGGRGMAFRRGAVGRGGWPFAPAFNAAPLSGPPINEAAQFKSQIDLLEQTLNELKQRLHAVEGQAEGQAEG